MSFAISFLVSNTLSNSDKNYRSSQMSLTLEPGVDVEVEFLVSGVVLTTKEVLKIKDF